MSQKWARTKHCSIASNYYNCDYSTLGHACQHARNRTRNSSKITLISSWIFIAALSFPSPVKALVAPDIIPREDAIYLEAGQDLELICHGDEPIDWHLENSNFRTDERINITLSHDSLPRPYTAKLTITNVTVFDAGPITCSYKDKTPSNSDSEESTEDFLHLYVKDVNNLLIPIPNPSSIHGDNGENITIPCRTSWKEVKIEILNAKTEMTLNESNYSIFVGFRILYNKDTPDSITCRATYQGKAQEQNFLLFMNARTNQGTILYSPTITVTNGGSLEVGKGFIVRCSTTQLITQYYTLDLAVPPSMKRDNDRVHEINGYAPPQQPDRRTFYKELHVKSATKEDAGNYTCVVSPIVKPSNQSQSKQRYAFKDVRVFDQGEEFLDVSTAVENITVRADAIAKWVINITSFPITFDYEWRNPKGEHINWGHSTGKYKIANTSKGGEYTLEIHVVNLQDMGSYPFYVRIPGSDTQKMLNLYLTVKAPPKVKIEPKGAKVNCKPNSNCTLECEVAANPPAAITWSFQSCNSSTSCESPLEVNETRRRNSNVSNHTIISVIEFLATHHAIYTCTARNYLNKSSATKLIRVVDPDFPVGSDVPIAIITQPEEVVEGDNVTLICALSRLDYDNETTTWFQVFGDTNKVFDSGQMIEDKTQWTKRKILRIENIQQSATGTYKCATGGSEPVEDFKHLQVFNASLPQLSSSTNLSNSTVSLPIGEPINLICDATGHPKPVIKWLWEDEPITKERPDGLKYFLTDGNTKLSLIFQKKDAQGKFQCEAENRIGKKSAYLDIAVIGDNTFSKAAIAIIAFLFIFVIVFGTVLARYKYKQGELNRFLKEISQQDFYKGNVENINPELSVTDQAYLLPFDESVEFPKDRLKLGIQLGSGAFGRVVKADAFGILDAESKTTVAVKMVKPNADESHFKALMSELKIMVHLGKHINVVNLLGACTKNLAKKKELFVIVEYCKYGSLLSYLHRNKRTFINQLDPARGVIDPNIDRPIDRNSEQSQAARKPASNGYRTLEEFKERNPDDPQSPPLHPLELDNETGYLTPNRRSTEHYVPESQVESVCTGVSYLSNGPTIMTTDGTTTNGRSSFGSQWQDHYRGDYQARDVQPIKTTDLLCWAFQISRGMEYLASRKVLHGDLAARNVLLAEHNVVKICDFGLAKEMYKDYKYKKKSEGVLLPVKWMAIESIYYGLFSTQSDCWSFGVVLWELFTLGKTPYPGMEADERFYKRISEGYRMEKPPLAPSCVYDIMLECWAQEPTERPTFSALVDRIGDMMSEGLRNHYVDLNAEYMRINHTYMSGRTDYLLQMGRTDFATESTRVTPERKYQNVPESEEVDSSGYLKPIPFASLPPRAPSSTLPQYQNIDSSVMEPVVVAINNGYQFLNTDRTSNPAAESTDMGDLSQNKDSPIIKVQLHYNPDIKDVYGFREDSTSPDPTEGPLDNHHSHVNIEIGSDGIRGVDNMNYVPNHTIQKMMNSQVEPNKINGMSSSSSGENGRRQNRKKNDSGLGSIDSTHFNDHHKHNSLEGQHHPYSEFGHLQDTNGYVTHQNITSL